MQNESGHQFRELYSQLETQNYGPNLENVKKRSYLPSGSTALEECTPHVRQKSSMKDCGDNNGSMDVGFQQEVKMVKPKGVGGGVSVSSTSALRRAGIGEIVEVQGGHIVRATGRKDRHSKVCTAKGPRDRRVRLAAHTAIQFYDVQDRLGYDRPSKAVDWLIKKAKASIDELEQLPAWSPTSMNITTSSRRKGKGAGAVEKSVGVGEREGGENENVYGDEQQQMYGNVDTSGGSLLPPSLDSDAIADTIKSFFPMGGGASATVVASSRPQQMQFQDYTRQSQDLRLSLQSFQVHDQNLAHSHQHQNQQHQSVFGGAGAAPVGYENPSVGWTDNQHQPSPEMGRLHRLVVGWHNQHNNTSIDQHHHHHSGSGVGLGSGGDATGGFVFNQPPLLQPLFGGQHNQFYTQRGPLQSSNTPSIRSWFGEPLIATTTNEHLHAIPVHPQGLSSLGFGGFSGFHIPARIQGDEEHDGDLKPSSASSGSHH